MCCVFRVVWVFGILLQMEYFLLLWHCVTLLTWHWLCDKGLKKAIFESNNKIVLLCSIRFIFFFAFENISMLWSKNGFQIGFHLKAITFFVQIYYFFFFKLFIRYISELNLIRLTLSYISFTCNHFAKVNSNI